VKREGSGRIAVEGARRRKKEKAQKKGGKNKKKKEVSIRREGPR
jgi:hypothetical protein